MSIHALFSQLRFHKEKCHEIVLPIHNNFSLTSKNLHPLQVENCNSNSRLVVGEDCMKANSGLKGICRSLISDLWVGVWEERDGQSFTDTEKTPEPLRCVIVDDFKSPFTVCFSAGKYPVDTRYPPNAGPT